MFKRLQELLFLLGIVMSSVVYAQAYPSKPISLIVPQAARGY